LIEKGGRWCGWSRFFLSSVQLVRRGPPENVKFTLLLFGANRTCGARAGGGRLGRASGGCKGDGGKGDRRAGAGAPNRLPRSPCSGSISGSIASGIIGRIGRCRVGGRADGGSGVSGVGYGGGWRCGRGVTLIAPCLCIRGRRCGGRRRAIAWPCRGGKPYATLSPRGGGGGGLGGAGGGGPVRRPSF
jgi:hypothetical protein